MIIGRSAGKNVPQLDGGDSSEDEDEEDSSSQASDSSDDANEKSEGEDEEDALDSGTFQSQPSAWRPLVGYILTILYSENIKKACNLLR